jgi:hypothetical protein
MDCTARERFDRPEGRVGRQPQITKSAGDTVGFPANALAFQPLEFDFRVATAVGGTGERELQETESLALHGIDCHGAQLRLYVVPVSRRRPAFSDHDRHPYGLSPTMSSHL